MPLSRIKYYIAVVYEHAIIWSSRYI